MHVELAIKLKLRTNAFDLCDDGKKKEKKKEKCNREGHITQDRVVREPLRFRYWPLPLQAYDRWSVGIYGAAAT